MHPPPARRRLDNGIRPTCPPWPQHCNPCFPQRCVIATCCSPDTTRLLCAAALAAVPAAHSIAPLERNKAATPLPHSPLPCNCGNNPLPDSATIPDSATPRILISRTGAEPTCHDSSCCWPAACCPCCPCSPMPLRRVTGWTRCTPGCCSP